MLPARVHFMSRRESRTPPFGAACSEKDLSLFVEPVHPKPAQTQPVQVKNCQCFAGQSNCMIEVEIWLGWNW